MLELSAKPFFLDINRILINHLLLEIAKITDPATSKKQENFTVGNIIESINWQKADRDELECLYKSITEFRKYILKARHKILAHYDKKVFLSGTVLGAFPAGEDEKLMETLEQMCNVLHKACFGGIYGDMVVTGPGDVHDFKKTMEEGIAFDRLFKESKGEELYKLVKYLDEVP